ncbi:MAG TPA: hypothetical protein VLG41_14155 [Hydrogenophaga sp.]|uniref:hypothetical protein n=1 Tax=Hydrogenophaga sp. TaxID=1904254 RepID=UPI002BA4D578|nr:hypothetical protein [Hydrogenophaga sp.]HSX94067.1 hypothetical protein [Hydrogenophaga sp.]
MTVRRALIALAAAALPAGAAAQAAAACTVLAQMPPARLSGEWTARFWTEGGSPERARDSGVLQLERHPEYGGSVRGELLRGSGGQMRRSIVSGDVTDGEFHLDESDDGLAMTAVWSGVAEDCGGRVTIRGTRRPGEGADSPDPVLSFRLERAPGWR